MDYLRAMQFRWNRGLRYLLVMALPAIAAAQGQFACRRVDSPAVVRSEGVNELLNDIVLSCTGGTPTPPGGRMPTFEFLITATVPLTSRPLMPSNQNSSLNEALLLVEDPQFTAQIGCQPQPGGEACPAIAGAADNPNVFQGRQIQDNLIAFRQIPIDAPGPDATRLIRFTNLRANIASLSSQSKPADLRLAIQMNDFNGAPVSIRDADQPAAVPKPGLQFSVRAAGDLPIPLPGPALTIPPASVPAGTPQMAYSFNVKFTEGFPGAFRRRNIGTSSDDPLFATVQAVPGVSYGTESGLFNSLLPAQTNMNAAGLADSGTRLRIRIQNIPQNVSVWVTGRDVQNGTTGYSADSPKALLTAADANGAGPLTPQRSQTGAFVLLPVTNGSATAVWEVINSDPNLLEDFSFAIAVTAQGSTPGQGTAVISGNLAPLKGGQTTPVPAFSDVSVPVAAFAISNVITVPALAVVSSANFAPAVAPDSIVSAFGGNLAPSTAVADPSHLPLSLANTAVEVIDFEGTRRTSPLYVVCPTQINFVLDAATSPGPALAKITYNNRVVASGVFQVEPVAPALFSANGNGLGIASGQVLRSHAGSTSIEPLAVYDDSRQWWIGAPIDVGTDDFIFLTLYGTGIRNRARLADVHVTINGLDIPVTYAGSAPDAKGLDQISIGPLPQELRGAGTASVSLAIGDKTSNAVSIEIR